MIYIIALLVGAWRLTDGGFHRHPVSNVIGWLLPVGISLTLMDNHILAVVIGALYGRQLTQGYENWDNYLDQAIRSFWGMSAVVVMAGAGIFGCVEISPLSSILAMLLVIVANVAQPLTRRLIKGHASNRSAEFYEGALTGASHVALIT